MLSHITLDTIATDMIVPAGRHRRRVRVPVRAADHRRARRRSRATRWPMPPASTRSCARSAARSASRSSRRCSRTTRSRRAPALAAHVTMLRPEVVDAARASSRRCAVAHGVESGRRAMHAGAHARRLDVRSRRPCCSFDRVFMFQGILFLFVIPLLFFLRVPRIAGEKVHVELPGE